VTPSAAVVRSLDHDPGLDHAVLRSVYGRSPFFEATLRAGCSAYYVYNHTYIPAYYDDPVTEYWHLLEKVTVWDVGVEPRQRARARPR
jgi:hypothetical protein